MGLLGRYIDGLSDVQRDRIIRATDWTSMSFWTYDGEPRCLVTHATGWGEREHDRQMESGGVSICSTLSPHFHAWVAFDRAVNRHGLDHVVRACKLRAAKGNRVTLPEPEPVKDATLEPSHA